MFPTLAATTFAAMLATHASIPTVETHASIPTVEIAPNVHLPFLTMGGVNATYQPDYHDYSNYTLWLEVSRATALPPATALRGHV